MEIVKLLKWQWDGYVRYHRSPANLTLHIVAVPLFLVGNIGLIVALTRGSITLGVIALLCMLVSVMLQARGHRAEQNPPAPFTGLVNTVLRIFLEQWITFPRFVLSGGWSRALRTPAASRPSIGPASSR